MRTLPAAQLRHTAVIHIPENVDAWQAVTSAQSVGLSRVHVQVSEGMRMTTADADVQMHAKLWYDCKLSRPAGLDFIALFRAAEQAGTKVRCTIGGAEYRVYLVELLPDGFGRPHHYELEME